MNMHVILQLELFLYCKQTAIFNLVIINFVILFFSIRDIMQFTLKVIESVTGRPILVIPMNIFQRRHEIPDNLMRESTKFRDFSMNPPPPASLLYCNTK